jgi:hypothetical protein
MGRQPTITLACVGCSRALRRAKGRHRGVQAALCRPCKQAVSDAYEAKLRADGVTPSVMPGNAWLPAWDRLQMAVASGDRAFLAPFLPTVA